MSDNNTEAIYVLAESMKKIAANLIERASFDKTVPGIITAVLNNDRYTVKINKSEYKMYRSTDTIYKKNDAVWVTIPRNNFNQKFISGRRR